jgi:hypothetical protein
MTRSNSSSALLGDLCAFAVQNSFTVTGRIPNGSWCIFREPAPGSRNGKVVIVQSRDIQDPDTGGQYTVKIYRSEKMATEDSWSHQSIRLDPDSNIPTFHPLLLEADSSTDLQVIGEFVAFAG